MTAARFSPDRRRATCDAIRVVEPDGFVEPDWADWNAAEFIPLEEVDADLAVELAGVLVDRFLSSGGLSSARREDALAQVRFRIGMTPAGVIILGADLPLGEGYQERGWDGSREDARAIAVDMGLTGGENVTAERAYVGDTGWEPSFDEPPA